MNKIFAVIKREYISIVKTKSFLIITLLIPLGFLLMMIIPFLMMRAPSGVTRIAILDESQLFEGKIESNRQIELTFLEGDLEILKETYKYSFDALLHIPHFDLQYPGGIRLFTEKQIGLSRNYYLERQIADEIEKLRYAEVGIDKSLIENLRVKIDIETIDISGREERTSSSVIALGLSYFLGFFQYMILFFYGTMIMRSVVDEKSNRIVEILVSSIRPFELMIGKIIGIAAVAITQLFIWIILISLIFAFFSVGVLPFMNLNNSSLELATSVNKTETNMLVSLISHPSELLNIPFVLVIFIFYFVFGYLLYSTLFASVGSLSDDDNQTQNFAWPISVLIIISILIVTHVIDNPHSPIALWASLIPFFSPIVMVARIPFNVPPWQLTVSMSILVFSFVFFVWVAGKIYRMGILLYGKKLKWKDLWKFLHF